MEHKQTGLVTVEQINKAVLHGTVLQDIIREQLIIIDRKILGLHKVIGENSLIYNLPITFITAPTTNTDTKIMVYYHILKNLESRGYTVNIDVDVNIARLKLNWTIGLNKENILTMENYLQERSCNI